MSDIAIADLLRKEIHDRKAQEESERLSLSFKEFIPEAWAQLKPETPYLHNWHIDALAEHLEAVTRGEIDRLQIWFPAGVMKTMAVSVLWHPWEWTRYPWLRYWTATYQTTYTYRIAAMSRDLMLTPWYQERWGHIFRMTRDAEHYFANDKGGTRLSTSPDSTALGEHGHRILIDDPINAQDADATSRVVLEKTNNWYDGAVSTRGIPNPSSICPTGHARILVMQRLHEKDFAVHLLDIEDWVVLCLPERYEKNHPFAWKGDKRKEGDLLWPEFRNEQASDALARTLGSHRAAGQLQQRPAAREGEILKRAWWQFYDPRFRGEVKKLPKFVTIVISVDTPLKDKESSDNVAIQCWGVRGADRYLLDLDLGKMNFRKAKRRVLEMARWARKLWPRIPHYVLIENAGYGVELITDLKREITGVQKISAGQDGDKITRAESASDALESGNCFLPGYGPPWQPSYDEVKTPSEIVAFIHNLATFPNAEYDDDVDAWSQCMNWLRSRAIRRSRTASPFLRRRAA